MRSGLIFTYFLFSQPIFGQDGTLSGTVTDQATGEKLPGVHVFTSNVRGTVTDLEGRYLLQVPAGTHSIIYRFVGYKADTATLSINGGEEKIHNVQLKAVATELSAVVVSAGKFEQELGEVTVSMELLKPSLVENKNTYTMESIVDQVPGVNVVDGQCNIRGGSGFSYGAGSRVMVLVDGMPMLAGDANDVKWNFLPVENLEQIEVIKGASSALFGSSALNGVINIRTAYPRAEPRTRINVFHGIYCDPVRRDTLGSIRDSLGNLNKPLRWWDRANPMYTGMNFFHSRKIKNLDLVVGGNVLSDQGYREGENEQRGRLNFNTRYRFKGIPRLSIGLNGNAQRTDGSLFLLWQDADSGAYRPLGGLDTATTTLSNYTTIRASIDPFITYYTKRGNRHELKGRFLHTNNMNDTEQESIANLYYAEYQFQRHMKRDLTITRGILAIFTDVFSELYGDHSGMNLASFVQADKKFGRLNLSLGLRVEYFKVDTQETVFYLGPDSTELPVRPVFRSGLSYRFGKATFLRASFGQGYRFPSIAEQYIATNVGQLNIFPNPELKAENGWSAELGVKQGFRVSNWNGYVDLAGFWMEYFDMMEFTFGLHNPDTVTITLNNLFDWIGFKSFNVGRTQIKGVELSLGGKGEIGPIGVSVLAGYTYMNPVNFNSDSAYLTTFSDTNSTGTLKYRYHHMAKGDLQLDWKKISIGWSVRYNSFMVNVDRVFEEAFLGQEITPGVKTYRKLHHTGDVVFDGRISYQVSQESKVALVVNNVFNREYMGRPADMQPPRTVALQYTLSF